MHAVSETSIISPYYFLVFFFFFFFHKIMLILNFGIFKCTENAGDICLYISRAFLNTK